MMNEKLMELAKDNDLIQWNYDKLEFEIVPDFECLDNFAKSIIQDCVSQIAMIGISNYEDNDVMWTVEKSIENIKEHFEVK